MDDKLEDLFGYVEERCLWQFFSRTWDREENIEGVLTQVATLLSGGTPARETPMEKLFYADAVVMVKDIKDRFSWAHEVDAAEIKDVIGALKARLLDVTITRSTNRELNHHLY